ncbi:hypothetical protein AC731_009525 [Thauera humireducens]|uniref:histidine kinase n=3 Tax=Thauera TaxID=33057 RepID=A0A127K5E5_9RHOO|nr:hypothetical protein AC731_009525 [Thauera humireducens]
MLRLVLALAASLSPLALQATVPVPPDPLKRVELSESERLYVALTQRITMCVDPDWEPFERINAAGEHEGIAADLLRLVAQRVGLELQLIPVSSWDESLEASKAGRCQILSFLNRTDSREQWLRFTAPIFLDPNVLITREEHPFIADAHALNSKRIALPRGTMVEERIRRDFPNLKVVLTHNEAEAIELVSARQADMTLRSLIVAAYTIKKEGLFNLKIAGQIPEYANALSIGVLKDESILHGILDKGVRSVTPQERELITNRHVAVKVQNDVDYALVWKVVIAATLVVIAVIAWNRKVGELERARAALAEQRMEEERRARLEQSRLVALLSHEVRTPLAIIDGAAQSLKLLLDSGDDERLRRVERIRQGVRRLTALTSQFLAKDRLDDETLTLRPEPADCAELLRGLQGQLEDGDRIRLTIEGDCSLRGDANLLEVALRNLLVNALRYSPPGSVVGARAVGSVHDVMLAVADNGPGLAPEVRQNLFASYLRGADVQDKPGAGLGLYLVKRVVDLHGGAISVSDAAARGTEFVITLPKAAVAIDSLGS